MMEVKELEKERFHEPETFAAEEETRRWIVGTQLKNVNLMFMGLALCANV